MKLFKSPHLFLSVIPCLLLLACGRPAPTYDLVIRGGQVLDGTGAPSIQGDVAIMGDSIAAVGDLTNAKAIRVIDATGLTIAPGFIDMHAHIEPLMRLPDAESAVRQGVTLAVGGPDGGGPMPFAPYLDSLDHYYKLGINVAYLTGHNAIRRKVMGNENRKPTAAEMDSMKLLVRQAMEAGAFGISTGLKYLPGTFAETSEVIELSKVAGDMGGIYTSHLREEGLGLLQGVREAIVIGREANIPIILTHHKAIGKRMWGASTITTGLVDSARKAGIDVMMDQYPYTASSTGLAVLFPSWAMEGSAADFKKRASDKVQRARILEGVEFNINNDRGGGDLHLIQFASVDWDTTLNGKTLYDYAVMKGITPDASHGAVLALEMQLKGGASCIFHAIGEEDVVRIMQHPFTMHASDGSLEKFGVAHPHPRSYGTFPRVLGYYVREKKVLPLEEAVRKMTSLPASRLGLANRGVIKPGNAADIVVFNPSTIIDKATFERPHQYPEGIPYVIVNGVVTVDGGKMTPNRGGKVVRKVRITD